MEDNEPDLAASFNIGAGEQDGRYFRGMSFKPVINGTFTLELRAYVVGAIGNGSYTLVARTTCPNVVVVP